MESVDHLKHELSEEHNRIISEGSKIQNYLRLAFNKSENILNKSQHMTDNDILLHYSEIYQCLTSLHLQLISVSCNLQLFFTNFDKSLPRICTNPNSSDIKPKTVAEQIKRSTNTITPRIETPLCVPNVDPKRFLVQNMENAQHPVNISDFLPDKLENSKFNSSQDDLITFSSVSSASSKETSDKSLCMMENISSSSEMSFPETSKAIRKDQQVFNRNSEENPGGLEVCTTPHELEMVVKNCKIPAIFEPTEGELCIMGYVQSPSLFYIHLVREETTRLDILHFDIEEIVENLPYYTEKSQLKKNIENECVCFCENRNKWCRGFITDWKDNESDLRVYLVDYGELVDVRVLNIREMVEALREVPRMTIPCRLAFLIPEEGKKWSKKSINWFLKCLNLKEEVLFKLSYMEKNGDVYDVDLSADHMFSVMEEMILSGNAKTIPPELEQACKKDDSLLCDFMKEQIIYSQGIDFAEEDLDENEVMERTWGSEQATTHEYDNPVLAVSQYEAKDEKIVCRFLNKSGGCWKGDNCRFSHERLNPEGWTTDRQVTFYNVFNDLTLPAAGMTATVYVIFIQDLVTFYVLVKSYPDMYKMNYHPVNNLTDLISMMNLEKEVKKFVVLPVEPAAGELVLVKYNNKWQRARVIQTTEHCDEVYLEVFLVDQGYTVRINMADAREMKKEYLVLPFQAVKCCLANVKQKEINDEQLGEGFDLFEFFAYKKTLQAKVTYSANHLQVLLSDENGNDIGEQLIEHGCVDRCTDYIINERKGFRMLVD